MKIGCRNYRHKKVLYTTLFSLHGNLFSQPLSWEWKHGNGNLFFLWKYFMAENKFFNLVISMGILILYLYIPRNIFFFLSKQNSLQPSKARNPKSNTIGPTINWLLSSLNIVSKHTHYRPKTRIWHSKPNTTTKQKTTK